MVQRQLCTLEHLMNSGFGRPYPRHGLQLLFWFANHCVTCELINFVIIMKLVSDCQPEEGFYGFHLFGNVEEILPVLERPRKRKKRVAYFVVGNPNTETYPAAANLPTYVRENYRLDGNYAHYNIDRIIISYQVRTRVVETVYVTEHDRVSPGRFSHDRTYEISSELIRTLQSPQLNLTTFLTQTGYYGDMQVVQAHDTEEVHYPPQQMFNIMQTYSGSTARTEQFDDLRFVNQHVNIQPFSYDQYGNYIIHVTSHSGGLVTNNSEVQHQYGRPKANKRQRVKRQTYWPCGWELPYNYKGFDEEDKKRSRGGGFSFFKVLLGAGVLYMAAKCFSWLRSWWEGDSNENILKMIPWRTPSYRHTHVMLDYVY